MFLDTCHSGNAAKNGFNDINGFINEQSSESHAWVYTATTGNEVAVEDPALNNGAFTKALVLGISGEAAFQEEETITTAGLYHFISARVTRLTSKHQHPVAGIPAGVPDFVLAKVRKESRASD